MLGKAGRICAGLLLAGALLGGCGREVKAPSLQGIQEEYAKAQQFENQGQYQSAEQFYLSAARRAEGALKNLVPGDPLQAEAERIRNDSALAVARIKEKVRKQEVVGVSGQVGSAGPYATRNLIPPVLAYQAPGAEKPAPPEAPKPPEGPKPPDGLKPPEAEKPPGPAPQPPKPDPTATEKPKEPEPPKEPVKPKEVRITKVVLKDNKVVLAYWTFTNLSNDKNLTFGAPAGKALSKSGTALATIRQTFQKDGFQFNAAEPLASTGKDCKADAFALRPGESRELITLGDLTENVARQFGGVAIELRMSEGDELTDKCMEVTRE